VGIRTHTREGIGQDRVEEGTGTGTGQRGEGQDRVREGQGQDKGVEDRTESVRGQGQLGCDDQQEDIEGDRV